MSFSPVKCLPKIHCALILILAFLCAANLSAQTKKNSADRKKSQEKTQANQKNQTKKTDSKSADSKKKADSKSEKNAKSKTVADAKKSDSKKADTKKQAEEKKRADARRAEENKRRAEEQARQRAAQEERRQAALAEQRRRAQLAREAQARRIAFERGLRTDTIENIEDDDTDGEDLEVRRAAVGALGKHAGTVVVLEAQTGRVLSIVNQDWAIRKSFKPCSTIKLVTGVAGINENMIDADGDIRARRFPLNLDDALAYSNNTYFQHVGRNLGNQKMIAYAQMLGLGSPTGINAKNETGGRLPYSNNNARIYSHGDDFEVTPLQLGVMVSAISNGGRIVIPQIPRTKFERTNFRGAMRYQLNLPRNSLQGVIPGMIGATAYGTARRGVDSALAVAGKTGSCIESGSWVGLFASVAPVENPQYAVVVITRGQSERGKYAAAIAGKIYASLKNRMATGATDKTLARVPLELRPQTKVNAKTAAKLDSDEDEDSEDNDAAVAAAAPAQKTIAAQPAAKPALKKTETKTAAELFPTIVVKVKKPAEQATRPRVVPNK